MTQHVNKMTQQINIMTEGQRIMMSYMELTYAELDGEIPKIMIKCYFVQDKEVKNAREGKEIKCQ